MSYAEAVTDKDTSIASVQNWSFLNPPLWGLLLIAYGSFQYIYYRAHNNHFALAPTASFYALPSIGISILAGSYKFSDYGNLIVYVAGNALVVLIFLSSLIRPADLNEIERQKVIIVLRSSGFVAFLVIVFVVSLSASVYFFSCVEFVTLLISYIAVFFEFWNTAPAVIAAVPPPRPTDRKLFNVRLSSSDQSSCDQQSEEIFEDTYMELRRNGMYQQAGEFRGRALHLILEFKKAENHVLGEFKKAAVNLSTEYEVMIENPQG
uniref:Uncharacterized protein n=1 Tax=Ditylenchus dipsaci TaxID=166011 RepID=A0A915E931_9BILA